MLKFIKYLFLTICIFCCAFGIEYGYTCNSGILPRITYVFMHANLFQLIVNLIGINSMVNSITKITWYPKIITYSIISSIGTTYISSSPIPTLGASGILYFLIGIDLVLRWFGCYFKISKKKMAYYTMFIILFLTITSFSSKINYKLHIINFLLGLTTGAYELFRNYRRKQKKDCR